MTGTPPIQLIPAATLKPPPNKKGARTYCAPPTDTKLL